MRISYVKSHITPKVTEVVKTEPIVVPTPRVHDIAFVSFANNGYKRISTKLKESVAKYCPTADVFIFTEYSQIGCPSHKDAPYSFKPYAIETVRKMGYSIIIWCDSCIRSVRNISELIPEIRSRGVFLQSDGWTTGQWSNDRSLDYFGLTRDDAMNIPAIYACIMAFDFNQEVTHEFLRRWKNAADDGVFQGRWKNDDKTESEDIRCMGHRHDQTCAEIISHQLNIPRGYHILNSKPAENPERYFTFWDFP